MTTDLLIGIIASVIGTLVLGGATYKFIVNKKNNGITQNNGSNQVAIQKSKNNSVNIGGNLSDDEKRN